MIPMLMRHHQHVDFLGDRCDVVDDFGDGAVTEGCTPQSINMKKSLPSSLVNFKRWQSPMPTKMADGDLSPARRASNPTMALADRGGTTTFVPARWVPLPTPLSSHRPTPCGSCASWQTAPRPWLASRPCRRNKAREEAKKNRLAPAAAYSV